MAICTFLGHTGVYDNGLYKKLSNAVCQITQQQDEIEFLIYSRGYFYALCLAASLEAKQQSPRRRLLFCFLSFFQSNIRSW